jgi:hypothetical protein
MKSALKALLAFGPSDTTNGVIVGSTRQTWPFYGAQKVAKTKLAILTTVLDISELEL